METHDNETHVRGARFYVSWLLSLFQRACSRRVMIWVFAPSKICHVIRQLSECALSLPFFSGISKLFLTYLLDVAQSSTSVSSGPWVSGTKRYRPTSKALPNHHYTSTNHQKPTRPIQGTFTRSFFLFHLTSASLLASSLPQRRSELTNLLLGQCHSSRAWCHRPASHYQREGTNTTHFPWHYLLSLTPSAFLNTIYFCWFYWLSFNTINFPWFSLTPLIFLKKKKSLSMLTMRRKTRKTHFTHNWEFSPRARLLRWTWAN